MKADWGEYRLPSEFNQKEIEFWGQYGIDKSILHIYNVVAIDTWDNKSWQHLSNGLVFGYLMPNQSCKLYFPGQKRKFSWAGEKPPEYCFGLGQLDSTKESLIICGGEKDCISLRQIGFNAICFSSENTRPITNIIDSLRHRFRNILFLYDNDKTGIEASRKFAKEFGCIWLDPSNILFFNGIEHNDVSDLVREEVLFLPPLEDAIQEKIDASIENTGSDIPNQLQVLFERSQEIRKVKDQEINFQSPLMSLAGVGLIYPGTINIIQGKSGVHKSHLAQFFSSIAISLDSELGDPLSIQRINQDPLPIVYIDTERNQKEQFPLAIQQILELSGYEIKDNPVELEFFSFLNVQRKERKEKLKELLVFICSKRDTDKPLIVILDVITDLMSDFNNVEDSLDLVDHLNQLSNDLGITFIVVIHENPGQQNGFKARGHAGTELNNKATVVIKLSEVSSEEAKSQDRNIYKLEIDKNRNAKRQKPVCFEYNPDSKGLEGLSEDELNELKIESSGSRKKIDREAFLNSIQRHFRSRQTTEIRRADLVPELAAEYRASEKTITNELNAIIEGRIPLKMSDEFYLLEKSKNGREIVYIINGSKNHTI